MIINPYRFAAAGGGGEITLGTPVGSTLSSHVGFVAVGTSKLLHIQGGEVGSAPSGFSFNTTETLTSDAKRVNSSGILETIEILRLDNPTATTADITFSTGGHASAASITVELFGAATGGPTATGSAENPNAGQTSISVSITPTTASGIVVIALGVGDGIAADPAISGGEGSAVFSLKANGGGSSGAETCFFYEMTTTTSEHTYTLTFPSARRPTVVAAFYPTA